MKGIRYELDDGRGLFQSIEYIGIPRDTVDEYFDDININLPIPWEVLISSINYKFYFTEKGIKRFIKSLDKIVELVESYDRTVKICNDEINDEYIVYQDEYQFAIEL